jgi:hypothetical protein
VPREKGLSPIPSALAHDDSKAKDPKPQINYPSTLLAGTGSHLVEEGQPSIGRARPPPLSLRLVATGGERATTQSTKMI